MSSERRMAAAALLISVFVAGALGGAAASRLFGPEPENPWGGRSPGFRPPGAMHRDGPSGPEGWPRGFAPLILSERVARDLDLTEEQRDQVREILEERQAEATVIIREIEPRLRAQLDSIRTQIRALLSPDQQGRFDEFLAREEEMFTRRMPPPDSANQRRR